MRECSGDQSLKISVLAALETEVFFTGALHYLCCLWDVELWRMGRWGNNKVPALHSGLHSSVPAIGHHLFGCRCQLRAFVCLLNFITGIYQQYHIFIAPPPHQIDRELQQLLTFFVCKIRIVARNNNF